MKYEKTHDADRSRVSVPFGGLDRSQALCGGKGSFTLRNLQINPDGTLERRAGMRPLVTLPENVRGVRALTRNGVEECYAVAGSTVYYLSCGAGGEYGATAIGTIGTEQGAVEFVCYDGSLLLLDGAELYTLLPDSVTVTQAYVPLYGKDWSDADSTTHVVYEDANLLTRQVRIRYLITSVDTTSLSLRLFVPGTIHRILLNGAPYTASAGYNSNTKSILLGSRVYKGATMEVVLDLPAKGFGTRDEVTCAHRMADIGRAEDARVMFYCMPDPTVIWVSRISDHAEREHVKALYPNASMLYVCREDKMRVGDGIQAVTGACRHYDRSLVFTTRGTWMAREKESGGMELMPVNTTLGCSEAGAVAPVGNSPMTVFSGQVLCWNSETDQRDECNARRISQPIESVDARFFGGGTRLFADTKRGEVWFLPADPSGGIPIYQTETKSWTVYEGIPASDALMLFGRAAVVCGTTVYAMDPEADRDRTVTQAHPEGESVPIAVEYVGSYLDFGRPGSYKRALVATVVAECESQPLQLVLERVDGRRHVFSLHGEGNAPSVMERRASIGRFRMLRPGITAACTGKLKLHELSLCTRLAQ